MSKTLYSVYRYIVLGLFLIINIWLFLLSIFSTSRLTSDASEPLITQETMHGFI